MDEKVQETKTAILNRIIKAVNDDTKVIPVGNLEILSNIVNSFDSIEMNKKELSKDSGEEIEKLFDCVKKVIELSSDKTNDEDIVQPQIPVGGGV